MKFSSFRSGLPHFFAMYGQDFRQNGCPSARKKALTLLFRASALSVYLFPTVKVSTGVTPSAS